MRNKTRNIPALILPIPFAGSALASGLGGEGSVEARIFRDENGDSMPYRIRQPRDNDATKAYPLVLCLHGVAGRGTDNQSRGTEAFLALSAPEIQTKYPGFLLTPQCPEGKTWSRYELPMRGSHPDSKGRMTKEMRLVLSILDAVRKECRIDSSRLYVTGQSMGGYGTWDIIARNPHLFAAAVPVCGDGDPSRAKDLAQLPIWIFHGAQDTDVPVSTSRDMYKALKDAGSKARYIEYPDVGHDSWVAAWREPELIPWLFEQRRSPP